MAWHAYIIQMEQPAPHAAETCLLLLSGLPGAGKTALARCLAREASQDGVEVRHVCFDELGCQPSSGGGEGGNGSAAAFSPEAWQLARRAALAVLELELAGSSGGSSSSSSDNHAPQQQQQPSPVEAAPASTEQDAASGSGAGPGTSAVQQQQQQQQSSRQRRRRLVIADDNLQYRSMRWQCYGLARTAGAAAVLLHVQCSEQLAQERNAARPEGERVPPAVISRMAAQFEAPGGSNSSGSGSSAAAWEHACLVECSADQPAEAAAVWQLVRLKWGAAAPPPFDAGAAAAEQAAAQAATAASRAHAVDVATRRVLSHAMQRLESAVPAAKAAAAQQLNAARRQLLQEAAAHQQQVAAEEPGTAAERWAAQFQQRCEAVLASMT